MIPKEKKKFKEKISIVNNEHYSFLDAQQVKNGKIIQYEAMNIEKN